MARVLSNSMKKVRCNRGKRGSESLLGSLEHLLPVSFVLDVLTPVADSFSSLEDTQIQTRPWCSRVRQRVRVYSNCVTSSHLLLDLLLDLLQVGSQVHGHLVFSSQQSLQHGVSRHTYFLQGGLLHAAQLRNPQLQLSDLKTQTDAQRHETKYLLTAAETGKMFSGGDFKGPVHHFNTGLRERYCICGKSSIKYFAAPEEDNYNLINILQWCHLLHCIVGNVGFALHSFKNKRSESI